MPYRVDVYNVRPIYSRKYKLKITLTPLISTTTIIMMAFMRMHKEDFKYEIIPF